MMKTFNELIEALAYKIQATGKTHKILPIRRPEDLGRASDGGNSETTHFDAIRHNAKLDAENAEKTGDAKKISDNKKMQHAGEIHLPNLLNPSHPDHKIEQAWFKEMSPESQRHVMKQHTEKQLADWKSRNADA